MAELRIRWVGCIARMVCLLSKNSTL